jgi:hypothetical protein
MGAGSLVEMALANHRPAVAPFRKGSPVCQPPLFPSAASAVSPLRIATALQDVVRVSAIGVFSNRPSTSTRFPSDEAGFVHRFAFDPLDDFGGGEGGGFDGLLGRVFGDADQRTDFAGPPHSPTPVRGLIRPLPNAAGRENIS